MSHAATGQSIQDGREPALAGKTGSITLLNFNVNDNVRIKLTDHGRQCLRKNYDKLAESCGGRLPYTFQLPLEDADGWSTWQAWVLMQELGPHVYMGGENPFDLTIRIETEGSNRRG